jgi:hypothetical protein
MEAATCSGRRSSNCAKGASATRWPPPPGLAVYDPTGRYAEPGREASQQYLLPLLSNYPEHWSGQRKLEVAETILAVLRGSWCTG